MTVEIDDSDIDDWFLYPGSNLLSPQNFRIKAFPEG